MQPCSTLHKIVSYLRPSSAKGTKVTKVRLRLSRDETGGGGGGEAGNSKSASSSSGGRAKMKTTTMIGGAEDLAASVGGERVDVVRAPLNRHLG